jgi:hypothetical protein
MWQRLMAPRTGKAVRPARAGVDTIWLKLVTLFRNRLKRGFGA